MSKPPKRIHAYSDPIYISQPHSPSPIHQESETNSPIYQQPVLSSPFQPYSRAYLTFNFIISCMAAEKIIWDGYFLKESQNNQDEDGEECYIDGQIHDIILTEFELNYDGNGLVKGSGHQQNGNGQENPINFSVDGQYDPNNNIVTFTKTINQSTAYFTGNVNEDSISGNWKETIDGPDCGQFELKKVVLRPGWNGYYSQFNTHHYMNFATFNVERVPEGKVIGGGTDEVGDFEIQGSFIYNENAVKFVKQYLGQHAIYYQGALEGNVVKGHWGFSAGHHQDKFRLELYDQ